MVRYLAHDNTVFAGWAALVIGLACLFLSGVITPWVIGNERVVLLIVELKPDVPTYPALAGVLLCLLGAITLGAAYTVQLFWLTNSRTPRVSRDHRSQSGNCVYLMRRGDGIYKIGKTNHLKARQAELAEEYGPMELVAAWKISDCDRAERLALAMTKRFAYGEGSRRELRQMTAREARLFRWEFSQKVGGA